MYEFDEITVSHCVCDEAFKSCLKMDGSNKSRLIGQFYFSQLSAPCFMLKKGWFTHSWLWSFDLKQKRFLTFNSILITTPLEIMPS